MKRVNSFFEAVTVITIICVALTVVDVLDGFPFKVCIAVVLLFIGYILKEILSVLKDKKDQKTSYLPQARETLTKEKSELILENLGIYQQIMAIFWNEIQEIDT